MNIALATLSIPFRHQEKCNPRATAYVILSESHAEGKFHLRCHRQPLYHTNSITHSESCITESRLYLTCIEISLNLHTMHSQASKSTNHVVDAAYRCGRTWRQQMGFLFCSLKKRLQPEYWAANKNLSRVSVQRRVTKGLASVPKFPGSGTFAMTQNSLPIDVSRRIAFDIKSSLLHSTTRIFTVQTFVSKDVFDSRTSMSSSSTLHEIVSGISSGIFTTWNFT